MLSLQDILITKVAVRVCTIRDMKREIFNTSKVNESKRNWYEGVKNKGTRVLETLFLPENILKKVIDVVPAIAMNMLTWTEYHEANIGFSRRHSANFLNRSVFTPRGTIDCKKAAEALIKTKSLSTKQKYNLACLYCLTDYIPTLFSEITDRDSCRFLEDRESPSSNQPGLITVWSRTLLSDLKFQMTGKREAPWDLNERLQEAVESGSKPGVEYSLENMDLGTKQRTMQMAAINAVRCSTRRTTFCDDENVLFRNLRYPVLDISWMAKHYYVDIVYFLLTKMERKRQIEFLMQDIEDSKYSCFTEERKHSRVLDLFLNWPYQHCFVQTAGLMWEFLPEENYAVLLLKICERIDISKEGEFINCDYTSYDYRRLLKEFWTQSPERYKRYVFSNLNITYKTSEVVQTKTFFGLLIKILMLDNFTYEDRENVRLILASATADEKENVFRSEQWENVFDLLVKKQEWDIADRLALNCLSMDKVRELKKRFRFTNEEKIMRLNYAKQMKWREVDKFLTWTFLPEKEIVKLKREMMDSGCRKLIYLKPFLYHNELKTIVEYVSWFFHSEDELEKFKKDMIFNAVDNVADMLKDNLQMGRAHSLIRWSLPKQEDVLEFKKNLVDKAGGIICQELISGYSVVKIRDELRSYKTRLVVNFKGGRWEDVDNFLTWCFSCEEEITDFKKKLLLKEFGHNIHFNLILANRWVDAGKFFSWLGLTAEETDLKRETLFNYAPTFELFCEVICNDVEYFMESQIFTKQADTFLGWHLTNKKTALEFRKKFKSQFCGRPYLRRDLMFKFLDSAIEDHFKGMEIVKEKPETLKRRFQNWLYRVLPKRKRACSDE